MKTTELFAELLIIGLGAIIWISFLIVGLFTVEPVIYALSGDNISSAVIFFVIIAASYVLGIILDRAYLPVWSRFEAKLMRDNDLKLEEYYDYQVKLAIKGAEELVSFMDYYASRLRILRASTINFACAAILGVYAFWEPREIAVLIFLGATCLSILSFLSYLQLANKYYGFVVRVRSELQR